MATFRYSKDVPEFLHFHGFQPVIFNKTIDPENGDVVYEADAYALTKGGCTFINCTFETNMPAREFFLDSNASSAE